MASRLIILGTGTSSGVPEIGCDCEVCSSQEPKNKRTRCSAVLQAEDGQAVLIDTAPELRLQAIANRISRVDAVVYTHFHMDHVAGIDDIRIFNRRNGSALPVFGDKLTLERIRTVYDYCFDHSFGGALPLITPNEIEDEFEAGGFTFEPIPVDHGWIDALGFRCGTVAYLPDVKSIPEDSLEQLRDLDILVIGALREKPHPTHLSIPEAVAVLEELKPRASYLTHLSHRIDHYKWEKQIPEGIHLAYDGLTLEF